MTVPKLLVTVAAIALPGLAAAQSAPAPSAGPSASPPSRSPGAPKTGMQQAFSAAFVEADVRRVADAVLGSMLKVDYSVDPRVQGNVTLRTAKPVLPDALLGLLETALASVDAAVIRKGDRYLVVPKAEARLAAPVTVASDDRPAQGYATEVVGLTNGSAREIARLLQQLLGKDAVAGTDPARNQIIITGTSEERAAAKAMIARFDIDAMAGLNYQLYKLESVDPDTLIAELEKVFQPPADIIGTRVRLVALPRLKSLLMIAQNRNDVGRIEPWIRRLDIGAGGKPTLYSYAVQHGRAKDVATSLQQVLTGVGGGDASTAAGGDSSAAPEASTAPAADPAEPAAAPNTPATPSSGGPNGLRIVPNNETNQLLIYATGEQYELIRDILNKIDQPVPQVLIEATLAEVTLTKDFTLGVDWSAVSKESTFRLGNSTASVPTAVFPGFSYAYLGNAAQAVVNTLQSKTNVKVLSVPKIIVLNNQPATLQVGDQVPIVVQQSQGVVAGGAPLINTVQLRDTGVILRVTPRVNDSNTVTLDISQEVSDVTRTTSSGINSPTIQQRKLTSTVATVSGQMVALGGLIRERASQSRQGIPIISQIPILGAAFGQQSTDGSRTELILLITPHVIRLPKDAQAVADELIDGMSTLQPLLRPAPKVPPNAAAPPPR